MTHKPSSRHRMRYSAECVWKITPVLCNKGHGINTFYCGWSRKWIHFHSFIPLHVCGLTAPLLWGSIYQTMLMWAWMHSLLNLARAADFTMSRNHAKLPYLITGPYSLAFSYFHHSHLTSSGNCSVPLDAAKSFGRWESSAVLLFKECGAPCLVFWDWTKVV